MWGSLKTPELVRLRFNLTPPERKLTGSHIHPRLRHRSAQQLSSKALPAIAANSPGC
jgi:hypothetical protein